jgi:hypothetical protein
MSFTYRPQLDDVIMKIDFRLDSKVIGMGFTNGVSNDLHMKEIMDIYIIRKQRSGSVKN